MKPSDRIGRCPPHVFHHVRGRYWVLMGERAFDLSAREWKHFRQLSLPLAVREGCAYSDFKSPKRFREFARWCREHGVLIGEERRRSSVSADELASAVEAVLPMWKYGPMHPSIRLTTCAARYTYLIEVAWYVSRAEEYLTEARDHAATPKLRKLFASLLRSERHHYKLLASDLGIAPAELLRHDACPGGRLLVAHFKNLARTDSLSFAATTALLEATEVEKEPYLRMIAALEKGIGRKLPGFRRHFLEDLDLGHQDAWREAIAARKRYPIEQASEIINTIHVSRHAIMAWQESIGFRINEANEIAATLKTPQARFFLRSKFGPELALAAARA